MLFSWKKCARLLGAAVCAVAFTTAVTTAEAAAFQVGDQGVEIAEFQGVLAGMGYDVTADGDFGPATVEAIKDFQKKQGMEVDGMVGQATYSLLMGGRQMPEVSRGNNYVARRIVQSAIQYVGVPYVFGGSSPYGFDCSGYVQYVFANCGMSLPRAADDQYEVGVPLEQRELRTGDLVYFSTYAYGASHVGIYLDDGRFIHASSSRGVVIDSLYDGYWVETYIGARRVL